MERMTTDYGIFEMFKNKNAGGWAKKSILAQQAKAQQTSEQTVSKKEEQPRRTIQWFYLKAFANYIALNRACEHNSVTIITKK